MTSEQSLGHLARRVARRSRRELQALRQRTGPPPTDSALTRRLLLPIGPADPTQPVGPRVVLLNDCRDQLNFGANALVDGLIASLLQHVENVVLVPVPSHWLLDVSTGYGAFLEDGAGLHQPRATFPELADQFEAVGDEWAAGRGGEGAERFLERFRGADLVVLNGEGSLYRTNLSAVRELFLAWYAKERLGIPTVFVEATVHLTGVVPILPGMARKVFPVLDVVAVREAPSLRNLAEWVPDVPVRIFPDSAFVVGPGAALSTPLVESIRARVGDRGYFCYDPGAMPMDHRIPQRSALRELILCLKRVTPQAVLVKSSPADHYIERIAAETDSLYVESMTDYREYMALVEGADFVATGRYHNAILAAVMGTAAVTFGSSNHKVHGAVEMLDGLIGEPYDGTYLSPHFDAIEQHARDFVARRDELRQTLIALCERRADEAHEVGRLVAGLLAGTGGSARPPVATP